MSDVPLEPTACSLTMCRRGEDSDDEDLGFVTICVLC